MSDTGLCLDILRTGGRAPGCHNRRHVAIRPELIVMLEARRSDIVDATRLLVQFEQPLAALAHRDRLLSELR